MADDQKQQQSGSTSGQTSSNEEKFAIPQLVRDKYPDLIPLIKETESMNDEEREYWFQILPIMTAEQVEKFRGILLNEKTKLAKLDKEYEAELTKLNEKHLIEWQEFESGERRKKLETAENKQEMVEVAEEAALLNQLNQI